MEIRGYGVRSKFRNRRSYLIISKWVLKFESRLVAGGTNKRFWASHQQSLIGPAPKSIPTVPPQEQLEFLYCTRPTIDYQYLRHCCLSTELLIRMANARLLPAQLLPSFLLPRLSWQTAPVTLQTIRSLSTITPPRVTPSRSPETSRDRLSIRRIQNASARPKASILQNPTLHRAFHATARRSRDHHFDTLKFVQRLQEEGFTEAQAVAMMKVLSDVIEERFVNQSMRQYPPYTLVKTIGVYYS